MTENVIYLDATDFYKLARKFGAILKNGVWVLSPGANKFLNIASEIAIKYKEEEESQ